MVAGVWPRLEVMILRRAIVPNVNGMGCCQVHPDVFRQKPIHTLDDINYAYTWQPRSLFAVWVTDVKTYRTGRLDDACFPMSRSH